MNNYVKTIDKQINSIIHELYTQGVVIYYNNSTYSENHSEGTKQITWVKSKNRESLHSRNFTYLSQYFNILKNNEYQVLLFDYSLIRFSYKFCKSKLITHNLLWWPCPVDVDKNTENEFGIYDGVVYTYAEKKDKYELKMRSPIRVDFDINRNTTDHPRAHVHLQHSDCRINCWEACCFYKFINHILINYYPSIRFKLDHSNMIDFNYDDMRKEINYNNKANFVF